MSYTPPSASTVDFSGSGSVVTGPRWDRVDFVTPPAVLLRGDISAPPYVSGQINHQVVSGAIAPQPSLSATITHQFFTPTHLSVATAVDGKMWKTHYLSAALSVSPVVSGSLKAGVSVVGALSASPVVDGRLAFVQSIFGTIVCSTTVSGLAYRPTYELSGSVVVNPALSGILRSGASIFGSVVAAPVVTGTFFREIRGSLQIKPNPYFYGTVTHSAGSRPSRLSGRITTRPLVAGVLTHV